MVEEEIISIKVSSFNEDYFKIIDRLKIDKEKLAELAFEELLLWINGIKRPGTLSELAVDRLYKIFSQASQPENFTEEALIRDLHFPPGQVRYLLSAVRKKYPDIVSPMIDNFIEKIKKSAPEEGKIEFIIPDDYGYIFRAIAKKREWGMEQFAFTRIGYGRLQAKVSEQLKEELIKELKRYL